MLNLEGIADLVKTEEMERVESRLRRDGWRARKACCWVD